MAAAYNLHTHAHLQGLVGHKGEVGFGGPVGMQGDTGPKGNQGPQGLQGNEVRVLFFCNIRLQ